MRISGDRNQCAGCGEYFNSTAAFDKHRTGEFGLNRRCMTAEEMRSRKMDKNAAGFWVTALNPMYAGTAPDCGACPGDGSICEASCKLAEESPA